ncbi:hypothetical protein FB451DRAFT_1396024 [Mycena latifolia]|nr:hypothetical protein FB451DRAFT_1396024 [Mycena latifolia]
MNFILALLVSFVSVAVATPTAYDPRADRRTCQIAGILCTGGESEDFCTNLGFQCQGRGNPILSSDAGCAAHCVCPC